jgi:hypothetical protein
MYSWVGGWALLAKVYLTQDSTTLDGETWKYQSIQMRWGTNYGNCVTVRANPLGLGLSVLFLFGHVLIIWRRLDRLRSSKRQGSMPKASHLQSTGVFPLTKPLREQPCRKPLLSAEAFMEMPPIFSAMAAAATASRGDINPLAGIKYGSDPLKTGPRITA